MTSPYAPLLAALSRERGVLGCLVVDEADGIVIASETQIGLDGDTLAAVAAALHRAVRRSAEAAGLATVRFLRLEATGGAVCAAGRDGILLVALTDRHARAGLLRAAMTDALEQVA